MAKKARSEPAWSDVKRIVNTLDKTDLIQMIGDLYRLSSENRDFLHARFPVGTDPLSSYKRIIKRCMYPDAMDDVLENRSVRISEAKRAISNYSKATGDATGEAELMTHFVECGNKFTLDYGDIDEGFYDSLVSMYGRAIKKIQKLPKGVKERFRTRLKKIMQSSDGIGWGYHDGLAGHYYEAFPEP